jgi:hypothetical protein
MGTSFILPHEDTEETFNAIEANLGEKMSLSHHYRESRIGF